MRELLNKLRDMEAGYLPSPEVTETIRRRSLLAFIGAFAVGKSTLMREIAQTDERFSEVISFTTRPSRGEGDTYRFIDNSVESINDITSKARRGDLVNFAVHPTTGHVYGTETKDYSTESCMLATTANNYRLATSKLPFHRVDPIIVVADPHTWSERISQRAMSVSDYKNRLSEARQSLEWSLDCSDVAFVDNTDTDIKTTASRFTHDWVADNTQSAHVSRRVAEKMLAHVKASE